MAKIKTIGTLTVLLLMLSTHAFACGMCKNPDSKGNCPEMSDMHHDMKHQKSIFSNSMMNMQKSMSAVKPTGNVDDDFIQNMIVHHQGAIDMAKIELSNGKDAKIKKMAKAIIDAQEKEIADMRSWLKKQR